MWQILKGFIQSNAALSPSGGGGIPANAIYDRAVSAILDRAGNYIEVR